jgi:hypothetical protein
MAWSGAVPPPRKLPKPPPKWVQAGLSKSQWDKLDVDGQRLALLKAQDQGINPTGDEALPIMYAPLLANILRAGLSRTIATRPPKKGHVRLWQGSSPKGTWKGQKPSLLTESANRGLKKPPKFRTSQEKESINQVEAQGRWWGDTKKNVKMYVDEVDGRVYKYLDVPKRVADKYWLPNMAKKPVGPGQIGKDVPHNPRAFSANPTQEWYFPPEADAILRSSRVYRPPLPPFRPSSVAPALLGPPNIGTRQWQH